MTRFWIALEQGVLFVINCIGKMHGGEIFIPKIPSMKVTDIADVIAPKAEREIIGVRPGEKINEILLTEEEATHAQEFDNYFVIEPEFPFWRKEDLEDGEPLPCGFEYTSDNNHWWLSKAELAELLGIREGKEV